ncbi:hypothetical protein [Amycolatopsis sp. DSM 110486]|uniref:hypothetical protein n=1 Tax=Amycolatopsis sp. DSM 110486 TaxID=2865832 RepID=UPI001C6A08A9|nr:hypothetical protein [Amycolatopsis sp. DSM 110486]QYN17463.1 hypothetical protein K1T34_32265 [Amycolatopsis sp. DSM 110486]
MYEYGLAPASTKRFNDHSPWASFGSGDEGRAAALRHLEHDPANRLVRKASEGTTWEECDR